MSDARLSLYKFDGCPWCERVRAAVADLGLEVEERDVREDPGHAAALQSAMGRGTVPVLRIDQAGETRWLPESADIVRYLYATYGEGRRPTLLAGSVLQTGGLVVAVLLLGGAFFVPDDVRPWLIVAAALCFALRNNAPLLRRITGW